MGLQCELEKTMSFPTGFNGECYSAFCEQKEPSCLQCGQSGSNLYWAHPHCGVVPGCSGPFQAHSGTQCCRFEYIIPVSWRMYLLLDLLLILPDHRNLFCLCSLTSSLFLFFFPCFTCWLFSALHVFAAVLSNLNYFMLVFVLVLCYRTDKMKKQNAGTADNVCALSLPTSVSLLFPPCFYQSIIKFPKPPFLILIFHHWNVDATREQTGAK